MVGVLYQECQGRTVALLRSARPTSIEVDTVVLAFRFSYHKEKMQEAENQRIAEKIVGNFLGRACQISCVDDNPLVNAALKMGAQRIDTEG